MAVPSALAVRGSPSVRPGIRLPPKTGGVLLAAASGVAVGATFSPYGGAVLPFLAFAPLGAALAARRQNPPGIRAAKQSSPVTLGFTAAFVAHGIGLYWMIPALAWRTGLAVPLYLLVLSLIGMLGGVACQAAAVLNRRWRWPLPLALAVCWTGSEWAAAHVPGFSYAWLNAGGSLAWHPALAAGSEVLGARFLTVWTVGVGVWVGAVGALWVDEQGGLRVRAQAWARSIGRRGALALGLAALPAVAGAVRQATLSSDGREVRIAAVQPGADRVESTPEGGLERWLGPIRAASGNGPLAFAVFPERHIASPLRALDSAEATPAGVRAAAFAEALGLPVLFGAVDVARVSGDTLWYNAAFLQFPDGSLSRAYRKTRLVPGLEGSGWWPRFAPRFGAGGYASGRTANPLDFGQGSIGALVCYDSAFGESARALVRGGAEWLVVLTNDDWLDPAAPFRVTWAYWQHATHGRLRAIENRISLLQVAATGYTFAVPPSGVAGPRELTPGAPGVAVLTAGGRRHVTVFTRTGDLLGLACVAVLALAVVAGAVPRRSSR